MNREATDLAGVRHVTYETLGSTNAEALARARAGERSPLWISAVRQEAGRGRRGNSWISPPGNLYASLLLIEPSPQAVAPQLSFVAGLALHDAVAECAPQIGPLLKVKWPNDLLIGGAKVAGILIEGENEGGFAVVIGFGVNCAAHPSDTPYPATDLATCGAQVAPQSLLSALAGAMQRRLSQWQSGKSFAAIRTDWLKRAAGLGQAITVRLPDREFSGNFEGLDEAGRLLVRGSAGVTAVTAGEVFGFSPLAGGGKQKSETDG
jgi:BirA family transcriptional regulator, biotin operon repressor / biotin---[acetyl-CoA-carboxylase] ligase